MFTFDARFLKIYPPTTIETPETSRVFVNIPLFPEKPTRNDEGASTGSVTLVSFSICESTFGMSRIHLAQLFYQLPHDAAPAVAEVVADIKGIIAIKTTRAIA